LNPILISVTGIIYTNLLRSDSEEIRNSEEISSFRSDSEEVSDSGSTDTVFENQRT